MARLIISSDGLADFGALDKPLQKKVQEVFAKFAQHTHAGLHLEKMNGAKDPRVRTIRIDQQYRGIVMAPDEGDTFTLHRVLTHDEADQWVTRNTFGVNAATGALEVQDVTALDEIRRSALPAATGPSGLFAERSRKDLTNLGIPESLFPLLDTIVDTTQLEALTTVLPQGQADALHMLAAGYTVEEAWAELVAGEDPGPVDTGDLAAALDRPASRATFYVAAGMDELLDVLNEPFAAWRVFLHPNQRRLAYRDTYNGPVRVMGGPGTGKTVVAVHRARALAERAADTDSPILFTTFTRNLAVAIESDLKLLAGADVAKRVEVLNVDRLAYRIVRDVEGSAPRIATDAECRDLWAAVVDESGTAFTPTFLAQEWRQVVLARGLSSRDAYLTAPRPGRGVRLNRRQRVEVWRAIEDFSNRLVMSGSRTYLQLADAAATILQGRTVKPYRHLIVDEAQDLHPSQWRMLRAAAAEQANDLFIVGDTHQRIYDSRTTLSSVGINIRGRSHRLRINYRTTHEILRWSLGLLRGEAFDDLDGSPDTLAGYRSQLHGAGPVLSGSPSRPAELAELASAVRAWVAAGVEPAAIGIAARTASLCRSAAAALAELGVDTVVLDAAGDRDDRTTVGVGTMHRLKGLEFRCMAVLDVSADHVPDPRAVTAKADDPQEHAANLQQERCLLYVACTRARDELWVGWAGRPSPFLEPML